MKASYENCKNLVNSSIDNRNKLVDEYSNLLAELLASVTWVSKIGERYILTPVLPATGGEKVIGWHTCRHEDRTPMTKNVVAVMKHIIVTTANDDAEEALEEFVHYICTKALPEFVDGGGMGRIPKYIYV